jgi:hypothetical protein
MLVSTESVMYVWFIEMVNEVRCSSAPAFYSPRVPRNACLPGATWYRLGKQRRACRQVASLPSPCILLVESMQFSRSSHNQRLVGRAEGTKANEERRHEIITRPFPLHGRPLAVNETISEQV